LGLVGMDAQDFRGQEGLPRLGRALRREPAQNNGWSPWRLEFALRRPETKPKPQWRKLP